MAALEGSIRMDGKQGTAIAVKSPAVADQTMYLRFNKTNKIGNQTRIILAVPRQFNTLIAESYCTTMFAGEIYRYLPGFLQYMCPFAQLDVSPI